MRWGGIRRHTGVNRWGFLVRAAGGRRAGWSALSVCVYIRNRRNRVSLRQKRVLVKNKTPFIVHFLSSELPRAHSSLRERRFSLFGEYLIPFELAFCLGRILNHFLRISECTRQRADAVIQHYVKGACVGSREELGIRIIFCLLTCLFRPFFCSLFSSQCLFKWYEHPSNYISISTDHIYITWRRLRANKQQRNKTFAISFVTR